MTLTSRETHGHQCYARLFRTSVGTVSVRSASPPREQCERGK